MIGVGQAPGLANYSVGQKGGATAVAITTNELPSHSHSVTGEATGTLPASDVVADVDSPSGARIAKSYDVSMYGASSTTQVDMAPGIVKVGLNVMSSTVGSGTALDVQNPYLAMKTCICVSGLYPSRN